MAGVGWYGRGACGKVWGHVAGVVAGCGGMWHGLGYVVGGQAYGHRRGHVVGRGGRLWAHVAGSGGMSLG